MSANHQKTLDDLEPVLEPQPTELIIGPKAVKPRSRDALNLYERMQELRLVEEDPLFS